MKSRIDSIYVLDLGWLVTQDEFCIAHNTYSAIKPMTYDNTKIVYKCFDFNGDVVREIFGKYVVSVDYKE